MMKKKESQSLRGFLWPIRQVFQVTGSHIQVKCCQRTMGSHASLSLHQSESTVMRSAVDICIEHLILLLSRRWAVQKYQQDHGVKAMGQESNPSCQAIAFGPYWSIGRRQDLSRHPNPGPASQAIPRYNKTSLFQPPGCGARCFLGSLVFSFRMGSRSRFDA